MPEDGSNESPKAQNEHVPGTVKTWLLPSVGQDHTVPGIPNRTGVCFFHTVPGSEDMCVAIF